MNRSSITPGRPASVLLAALVVALAASSAAQASRIYTVAGTGRPGYSGDGGPATAARLDLPRAIAPLPDGSFVFPEADNSLVRFVSARGIIATVAGTGARGFSGDGGPAPRARLNFVHGVAVLSGRSLLVADTLNHRIRRVDSNGTIATVAGTGTPGYSGDGGPATGAAIDTPRGVAAMTDGGFLIPDSDNDRVRRVLADGRIVTVAGNGVRGFSGDGGPATAARLARPFAVAPLRDGGFLIADAENIRVRRVFPNGIIRTVAGNGRRGYGGDGGPATAATLQPPQGLAATADGGFVMAEPLNHRVRRVSPAGIITTVAGTGIAGATGDGKSPRRARLNEPKGVAPTPDGGLLIAEAANRVRFVAPSSTSKLAVALLRETFRARRGRLTLLYAATVRARLRVELRRGTRRVGTLRFRGRSGRRRARQRLDLPAGAYRLTLTARASGGRLATDTARLRVSR